MTLSRVLIASALLTFSLAACAADGTSGSAGGGAEAAIAAAKSAMKESDAAGASWRDTGKMIKKAEELAKNGKAEEAIKIANEAKMQSMTALEQFASQKEAGPRY